MFAPTVARLTDTVDAHVGAGTGAVGGAAEMTRRRLRCQALPARYGDEGKDDGSGEGNRRRAGGMLSEGPGRHSHSFPVSSGP